MMSNVIQLVARKNADVLSEPDTCIAATLMSFLASREHFGNAVAELLKQFDSIQNAIDTIDDTHIRDRLQQSTQLSRKTLSKALLELAPQIETVVDCHGL
jgi:hypothetical protein